MTANAPAPNPTAQLLQYRSQLILHQTIAAVAKFGVATMSNRLSGKLCIITGTGGGMGRESALTIARGRFDRWLWSVRRGCGSDRRGGSRRGWNNALHAAMRFDAAG